jgi:hypothetical protein
VLKLFMFYVGGKIATGNTELHDVRFSLGETVEDCHRDLRAQWWGTPESLHIDCWGVVEHADGHVVLLAPAARASTTLKLFFVNLGGYDPSQFTELHHNLLLVETDKAAAKARALLLISSWKHPHRDNLFEVEHMLDLSGVLAAQGIVLQLSPATEQKPFTFQCGYWPIGQAVL